MAKPVKPPRAKPPKPRHEMLREIRSKFIAGIYPRLTVLVLIGLSGAAAWGVSTALFRSGTDHMGARYAAAAGAGYVVFLVLIKIWIELRRPRDLSGPDFTPDFPSGGGGSSGDTNVAFSGGGSGGGGSSGSWGSSDTGAVDVPVDMPDVDEAWPIVVAIVIAVVVLFGAAAALFYVVYYAPLLLAEVALDAALVTGIYRRLRKQDARHWLTSAIRHTWKPAVVMLVCLFLLGIAIQWAEPSARTLGDVLR
jgi:FtsH-binding integral membrane protein